MPRPLLPGSLDKVKDLKTSDPHGVLGCCKTKQNLSEERMGKNVGIITQLADIILHNFKEPKDSTSAGWEKTTIAVRKIESISSKKTKEMPKQKPEYVMDAVNGNIEGVCFACGPGGKEGRSLFAPVELCYVTLYWSMIHKQRV